MARLVGDECGTASFIPPPDLPREGGGTPRLPRLGTGFARGDMVVRVPLPSRERLGEGLDQGRRPATPSEWHGLWATSAERPLSSPPPDLPREGSVREGGGTP